MRSFYSKRMYTNIYNSSERHIAASLLGGKGLKLMGYKGEENMLSQITEFPKIGEQIERFIDIFGSPARGSGGQSYYFDIEGIEPRLLCEIIDGKVYSITWSLPYPVEEVREIATRFLPEEAYLEREGVIELDPILNEDVPMKDDYYRIRDSDEDLFLAVGENSSFNIYLEIKRDRQVN
jgi:hypothetical protein